MKLQGKNGSAGFTLMEILVVIIILGVLAGLAAPVFTKTQAKAKKAEAVQVLNAVRQSQIRYFAEFGTFASTYTKLDFSPTDSVTGATPKFGYAAADLTSTDSFATDWKAVAKLTADTTKTVTITQTGAITDTF